MTGNAQIDSGGFRTRRCALFLDFDNIYLGLHRLDPETAEKFATRPGDWLSGLETGTDTDGDFRRRFLVLTCYLNPSTFSRYRAFFTRAGFSVIDCPSLTQQGKSSADLNLALGAMDALAARIEYEEFVIATSDADFTPLAIRLRAADRRVTMVTSGPTASAYRAVADSVITAEQLVEFANGDDGGTPAATEEETTESPPSRSPTEVPDAARAATPPIVSTPTHNESKAIQGLRTAVKANGGKLQAAQAAQAAIQADAAIVNSWAGQKSFRQWITRNVQGLVYEGEPSPGWIIDPTTVSRDKLPQQRSAGTPTLFSQVASVTDVPLLSSADYKALLTFLADDINTHSFSRVETGKRVRNECQLAGHAISRATVNFVVNGLLYAGHSLNAPITPESVATHWADVVADRCNTARMELTPQSAGQVRKWVGGGLAKRRGSLG